MDMVELLVEYLRFAILLHKLIGLAFRDCHQGSCRITSWQCYLFCLLSWLMFHLLQIFGAAWWFLIAAHVPVASRTLRRIVLQHSIISSWWNMSHFSDIALVAIIGYQSWPSAESMILIHFLRQRLEMHQLVASSKVPPMYVNIWLIIIHWEFLCSILLNSRYRCHRFIIVVLSTLTFQCLQLMSFAKAWSWEQIARFRRLFSCIVSTLLLLFKLVSEL